MARRKAIEEKLSWSDKLAQRISDFVGNIWFVWVHAFIFSTWIVANIIMGESGWDPYPFIFLVLVVSLEAIILSTFILMAQNRESRENEIRDALDYDVDQRAESTIQEIKKTVNQIAKDVEVLKKK